MPVVKPVVGETAIAPFGSPLVVSGYALGPQSTANVKFAGAVDAIGARQLAEHFTALAAALSS